MPVDRCYCAQVTFAELIRLSAHFGLDVDVLASHTGCGTGCGLCRPYIRVALATRRAELPVMTPRECSEIARPEGAG